MTLTTEQLAVLRLLRTDGIGPVTFRSLMKLCGSAQEAMSRLPELCKARRRRPLTPPPAETVLEEVEKLTALGGRHVFEQEDCYPFLLKHIADAPPVLRVLGDPTHLATPMVAVVGNRNASARGSAFTRQMAAELAGAGQTVISGMARGIDTNAHGGALEAGGKTVAVLAGGADVVYPPENRPLYEKIMANGCVISEMACGAEPIASWFPRRNRIVSGCARAVAVVEAGKRSGSLITARLALQQGREVFAVPGAPGDPRASGPNSLLKEGASFLESATDMLEFLEKQPSDYVSRVAQPQIELPLEEVFSEKIEPATENFQNGMEESGPATVADFLSPSPVGMDDLMRACGLTEAEVMVELAELELEGRLERHPGGGVSLRS